MFLGIYFVFRWWAVNVTNHQQNVSYLYIYLQEFFILKVEDTLLPHGEGLLAELHAELLGHVIGVERVRGGVLFVEEINLQNNG